MGNIEVPTGMVVNVVLGLMIITIVVILISVLFGSIRKTKALNQLQIVTDELDRQRKENIHLQDELKRINSMDKILFASMIRLTARLNPLEIARETTNLLVEYLHAEEIAVLLADTRSQRLTIVDQRGLQDDWIPKLVYELGNGELKGRIGACFEKKLPIGEREARTLGIKEPYPIFSPTICFPLFYQNRSFGVIAITRKDEMTERERSLIGVVSSIVGVALHNTRSFADITLVAQTDQLTRLFNIGYFKQVMDDELKRAKRFQHMLSVTIIDLDNFKSYNDTHGHQAGDQLLIQMAQIFREHFDATDTIARYGGDEFVVLCPETSKGDVAKVVDDLRHSLETYDFTRGSEESNVTFSAGIASFPDDGMNTKELIKSADSALYDAKDAGKNVVKLYQPKVEEI
jgi:diguanylate cyclase (GGDEF)-like protein